MTQESIEVGIPRAAVLAGYAVNFLGVCSIYGNDFDPGNRSRRASVRLRDISAANQSQPNAHKASQPVVNTSITFANYQRPSSAASSDAECTSINNFAFWHVRNIEPGHAVEIGPSSELRTASAL